MPLYTHCTPTWGPFANPFAKCDEATHKDIAKSVFDDLTAPIAEKYPKPMKCAKTCMHTLPSLSEVVEVTKQCTGKGDACYEKEIAKKVMPVYTCMSQTEECGCVLEGMKEGMKELKGGNFDKLFTTINDACSK